MEDASRKIRLYALSTCPACKRVIRYLEDNKIAFEKIDMDMLNDAEQWATTKEVKRYNPEATYPTLVIEQVIVGFDEDKIREALEIK